MAIFRKIRDLVVGLCMLFLGLLIIAKLQDMETTTLSGPFYAVDGDTLDAVGQRLRVAGIDAPERDQICRSGDGNWSCGEVARDRLDALVGERGVRCDGSGRDRYGRLLVACHGGQGDIGALLVREGLAVAYGDYRSEENEARAERRGLWAGTFTRPEDFRRQQGVMGAGGDDWLMDVWSWLQGLVRGHGAS